MTKPPADKPTTPPTPPPPDDAELHAHEQADKDAGSSWKTVDDEELREQEARGYRPGLQPAREQRPPRPT